MSETDELILAFFTMVVLGFMFVGMLTTGSWIYHLVLG